jgi:tetratricopeptide (TPR) repeat protein
MKKLVLILVLLCVSLHIYAQTRPDALFELRQGNYARAVEITLAELEDDPNNMNSYSVLCWSLISLGRYQQALDYGLQALRISPSDVRIIEILGEANYWLAKYDDALRYFSLYADNAPSGERIGLVYYYMGRIFIQLKEFNRADISFTTAVYHNPNNAVWWERLGYAREQAGDFSNSLVAYEQALKLNQSNINASQGRSRVLQRL